MSKASVLAQKVRRQGFDLTTTEDGSVYPQCSQCEALVIQGLACHETGCINAGESA